MRARLRSWAAATFGPDAEVDGLTRLPGHSGIMWAFALGTPNGTERLVLRPPPLLGRAAAPRTTCTGAADAVERGPRAVVRHPLPGRGRGGGGAARRRLRPRRRARTGPRRVRRGHADAGAASTPLCRRRDGGRRRRSPPVVDHWRRLLAETPEPSWIPAGRALHAGLRAAVPETTCPCWCTRTTTPTTGWWATGARRGPRLGGRAPRRRPGRRRLDRDDVRPASWHPGQRPDIAAAPDPEELIAAYGAPVSDVAWFRALAGCGCPH